MTSQMQQALVLIFWWIDSSSIPQGVDDASDALNNSSAMPPMVRAVNSNPAFVEACDFMVICLALLHKDTGKICDLQSYKSNGWGRLEMAARFHSRWSDRRLVAARAPADIQCYSASRVQGPLPAQGEFSEKSIPAYVEACDVFTIVCPVLMHKDTGKICDSQSYSSHGWCRLEMTARFHPRRSDRRMVVIRLRQTFSSTVLRARRAYSLRKASSRRSRSQLTLKLVTHSRLFVRY